MSRMFELVADYYYRGHLTNEEDQLARLTSASLIAVDMESVSLSDLTAIGIGMYVSPTEGYYFPIFPRCSEHLPLAMWKISDTAVTKIYHNGGGFDLPVLDRLAEEEGYERPDDKSYHDTSIWGQCSGLPRALQRIGEEWLGAADLFSISDLFQENSTKNMLGVPEQRCAEKCLNDCRTTYQLYEYLGRTTSPQQRDCYEVDRRLVSVLRAMQAKGIGLRTRVLEEHAEQLRRNCLRIQAECDAEGFNPGSPQQVGYVLASRGNVLPIRRKRIVTNEEALEDCEDELAKTVLEYRHDSKLLSTYILPWLVADRAYTHFRLDLSTGRLASGRAYPGDGHNRNLQNIPSLMREIFRPDSGIWTWADHSQIELRVLAAMSHDPVMEAEYAKPNPDLHTLTAQAGGVTRDQGKTANFAMIYGGADRIISRRTGIPLDKVKPFRTAWNSTYNIASQWMTNIQYNHGDWVEDAFGRRMRLPEMQDHVEYNERAFKAHVDKCAINYSIQGTAATIMKKGMLWMVEQDLDLRLSLHDEYLLDGTWITDGLYNEHELAHLHPEIRTPFEVKSGAVWS